MRSIKAFCASTFIFLNAFATIQAFLFTDSFEKEEEIKLAYLFSVLIFVSLQL